MRKEGIDKKLREELMRYKVLAIIALVLLAGSLNAQNMFGAFVVRTEPSGASVNYSGSNQYIGQTPTQAVAILMDHNLTYNNGTPGRRITLEINKEGYKTLRQQVFVPFNKAHQQDALRNPSVFSFSLRRDDMQSEQNHPNPPYHPNNPNHHNHPNHPNNPGHHGPQNERRLTITTQPRGALIYVNDQYVGRSPLTVDPKVRPGEPRRFVIRAEKRGYRTATEIVSPREDRVRLVLRRRGRNN
ncbi:MAG: hypothetical protein CVU49_06060 [Candidatus Cloacimonetes bacterium HGW-Cloacimonetes-2]|jgi:hypothetical protein|nr:MAG: hypothetical protein CVU49_06060 [Candidatus Cloacimonetes bacterium HGW-Cloacimonetes-2]